MLQPELCSRRQRSTTLPNPPERPGFPARTRAGGVALVYNTRFITIKGKTGKISIKLENVPAPDNPKTAWLACCSALAALMQLTSRTHYGT